MYKVHEKGVIVGKDLLFSCLFFLALVLIHKGKDQSQKKGKKKKGKKRKKGKKKGKR